jgi:hypothetical protein
VFSDLGWIDPDFQRTRRGLRETGGEALRVRRVCRGQHGGPGRHSMLSQTVMHVVGRQQTEAGVMVLGVVPGAEDVAVPARVLDRADALR